jgi:hypothetical protein
VSDLRSGAPDGIDTVRQVENFKFSDGIFAPSSLAHAAPPSLAELTSGASATNGSAAEQAILRGDSLPGVADTHFDAFLNHHHWDILT